MITATVCDVCVYILHTLFYSQDRYDFNEESFTIITKPSKNL